MLRAESLLGPVGLVLRLITIGTLTRRHVLPGRPVPGGASESRSLLGLLLVTARDKGTVTESRASPAAVTTGPGRAAAAQGGCVPPRPSGRRRNLIRPELRRAAGLSLSHGVVIVTVMITVTISRHVGGSVTCHGSAGPA